MLDHYHMLVRTLNDAESVLLDDHSQELLRVFRSGFKRLNWNSLGDASRLLPRGVQLWVGSGFWMRTHVVAGPWGVLLHPEASVGSGEEVGVVCTFR